MTGVDRYTAVVEMVFSVGLRYRDNPVSNVSETYFRESGEVHPELEECTYGDCLRSLVSQRSDVPASGQE